MFDQIKTFINPSRDPDLSQAQDYQRQHLPTLWVLGKTGAGKSLLIQTLTGLSSLEIGNGFAPCTLSAQSYEFPQDQPIMRFVDTRGLAEANYDPQADLAEVSKSSHALVVVMKTDEPEQSAVINALKQIKKQSQIDQLLLVHSAVMLEENKINERQISFNTQQVKQVWGSNFDFVAVDFETENGDSYNIQLLINKLSEMLPIVSLLLADREHSSIEEANFDKVATEVLWYSTSASSSDLIPAVGLVSVPAIQAKMLHSLANRYGVAWNRRTFSELMGAMGSSFAVQYGVKLGARQLAKLLPVYGQSVGAIAAASVSFATTYGLGRAACYYFYYKSKNQHVNPEALQQIYKEALTRGKRVSGDE